MPRMVRVSDSAPLPGSGHEAVYDHLHQMFAAVVDGRRLVQVIRTAIDPQTYKTGPTNLFPERLVFLLATTLQRRHHIKFGAFRETCNLVDNLIRGLCADGDIACRAMRLGLHLLKTVMSLLRAAAAYAAGGLRALADLSARRQSGATKLLEQMRP